MRVSPHLSKPPPSINFILDGKACCVPCKDIIYLDNIADAIDQGNPSSYSYANNYKFEKKDEEGKEKALFSGDTLFIGDVGRPDLAQKMKAELTEDILAGHLFDSLRNKIMPLADDIIVYPAHGAGSACGKKMSKETIDTLGHQKRTNYALDPTLSKERFKAVVLEGLVDAPGYFPLNVLMNTQGYDRIDKVLERGQHALRSDAFEAAANETSALILDTRKAEHFAKGFIPNSINIGIDGNFAPWVGTLIPDSKQEILLVTEEGREEEAVVRLARVGYDFTIVGPGRL